MKLDNLLNYITCSITVIDSRTSEVLVEGYLDPGCTPCGSHSVQRIEPVNNEKLILVVSKE